MSVEERNLWIGTWLMVATLAAYTVILALRLRTSSVDDVAWQTPMLVVLVVGGGIFALVTVVAYLRARGRREPARDERDADIERHGELSGKGLLDLVVLVTLVMLALGAGTFWVAHVLFYGSALAAVASTGARLQAYRQGLPT